MAGRGHKHNGEKPNGEKNHEHIHSHPDSETETIATDIPGTGDMPVRAHLHPVVKSNK